jgi:hypothetical protein
VDLVAVADETRGARYLDARYAFVHAAPIGTDRVASLTAGYRHERVDPLYRSVAAPQLRSDYAEDVVDLTAAIGDATMRVSYGGGRDNLAAIASILTTRTRTLDVAAVLPPTAFRPTAVCGPTISYQAQRVGQAGDGLPVNGEFDSASHVPDQVNVTHGAAAEFGCPTWRAGYRLNRSLQDNRQPGRETADFATLVHEWTISGSPSSRLDLSMDVGVEDTDLRETARRTRARRVGGMATVRFTPHTALQVMLARSVVGGDDGLATVTDGNAQISHAIVFAPRSPRPVRAQLFVRVTRRTQITTSVFADLPFARGWTVNSGVTVRFF